MRRKKTKQFQVTALLIITLCFMAIGYSLLSARITINGTANFMGDWSIQITSITSKTTGLASNKVEPSGIGTTSAIFNVDIYKPGDKIEYTITMENKGSVDAIVSEVTLSGNDSEDVNFTAEGIARGNVIGISESLTFKVIVEYKSNATTVITGTKNLIVDLEIVQKEGSNIKEVEQVLPIEPVQTITTTVGGLTVEVVETGDGLYTDSTESGKYIYRGANPNNYITFNNEVWRILSVEANGTMKIVKSESIDSMQWDAKNTRSSSTSTYCTNASDFGCNAWAATSNLVGAPSEFKVYKPTGATTDANVYSGTVTQAASLNTYLNNTYYNTIGTDKKYIVAGNFYVGSPGTTADDTDDIATNTSQEKQYTWNGKVGLIQVTDYLKTSTDSTCTTLKAASNYQNPGCETTNWLKPSSGWMWTISPDANPGRFGVWYVISDGYVNSVSAYNIRGVRPAVYLSSNIHLSGTGEQGENSYKIMES